MDDIYYIYTSSWSLSVDRSMVCDPSDLGRQGVQIIEAFEKYEQYLAHNRAVACGALPLHDGIWHPCRSH